MTKEQYLLDLIEVAKNAQRIGLCKHKSGNFSIYNRVDNEIYVTPSAIDREKLTVEDICVLDIEEMLYIQNLV